MASVGQTTAHAGAKPVSVRMGAEMTFLRRPRFVVNVESIVRACLHATFATDAGLGVDVDDTVRTLVEGRDRTNGDARSVRTLVAP